MWKPGSGKPPQKQSAAISTGTASTSMKAPTSGVSSNEKRPSTKSVLSQKTLAMKFMQRKKTTDIQKHTVALEQKKADRWVGEEEPDDDSGCVVCIPDVPDPSLPLIFGRRSFGGFNKAVEDEYRDVSRQLRFAASEERELREEISAEEMTDRMMKYTGLMRGGSGGGRNPTMRSKKRQRN